MFFFNREKERAAESEETGLESIAPLTYFTAERRDDLTKRTLANLSTVHVKGVHILDNTQ